MTGTRLASPTAREGHEQWTARRLTNTICEHPSTSDASDTSSLTFGIAVILPPPPTTPASTSLATSGPLLVSTYVRGAGLPAARVITGGGSVVQTRSALPR